MITKEIETELGTRMLFLTHGGSIKVTHADNGLVRIDVASTDKSAPLATVEMFLDVREALTLVEFLAIALKPGAGNQIITANDELEEESANDELGEELLKTDPIDPLERRRRWLDATFGPLKK